MEGLKPLKQYELDNTQTLEVLQTDISPLHLLGIPKTLSTEQYVNRCAK